MKYIKLVLSGNFHETGMQTRGLSAAARREGFRFDEFFLKTEYIINTKSISKILLECRHDFSTGLFSGLEEIRERVEAMKQSGKEIYFYAHSYGVKELFLAAACNYRLMHPLGTLRFSGLSQSFLFAGKIIRRFGINAEIFRRRSYKSAGDIFRADSLDNPNREQYEHFLTTVMGVIREGVREGFEKTEDDIEQLLNGEVLNAEKASDAGWIDEIVSSGEFLGRWDAQKDREFTFKKVPRKAGKSRPFSRRTIAVLVFEGAVADGYSKRDPLMGQSIGAESFIPQIIKLRDDKKIKAVVLRINSGGGSAFASEDITAELRLLAEKKPLVVSMSEVAGSGGYWMSCCGRKTLAMPTSLTGSIGVISIYLSWRRLLESAGINHATIKIGEHADQGLPFRELSDKEKQIIDNEIGEMYVSFVNMVAEARGLSPGEIDKLAGGRVWPGCSAADNQLIDELGGLSDAIETAAAEALVNKPVVRFYPEIKHGFIERMLLNMSKEDEAGAGDIAALSALAGLYAGKIRNTGPLALVEEVLFRWN